MADVRRDMRPNKDIGRYAAIFSRIFSKYYVPGMDIVPFEREEIAETARELGIGVPKNLGDVVYAFKFRRDFEDAKMRRHNETAKFG